MQSDFIEKIDKFIRWSFYALFFLVPLVIWPSTYELFEFNKMWVVFAFSLIIAFLWGAKMIIQKRFELRRTPLDIPIALFLLSQIISTIFSMDPHVSFWGYYSRFNGGLLSTISYIFLYYAFASNLTKNTNEEPHEKHENKPISYSLLTVSLLSGLVVTLWGLPSHFGADPTCFIFRGTLDVSCWTAAFQPTIRIFSTLGQPNWLGTYLSALIPIALGFGVFQLNNKNKVLTICYLLLTFLFFLALLYTRSQSGFLGLVVGILFFFGVIIFKNSSILKQKFATNNLSKYLVASIAIIVMTAFFVGTPIQSLNKFTSLSGLQSLVSKSQPAANSQLPKASTGGLESNTEIRFGGSESGDIRLIVWQGALELFRQKPLFGTGVETFAYSYYSVKPLAHNLTSEWDFLYNKAHNEYLNYLATTGIFGLGTYLLMIAVFTFYVIKQILKKTQSEYFPISIGIFAGFIAMLISNFFGFSVVVINLFIFIFPILFFDLENYKTLKKVFSIPKVTKELSLHEKILPPQAIAIVVLLLVALYYLFFLFNFWNADKKYAYGYNLNHASEYGQGYQPLFEAVRMLPNEYLYKDELSLNMATLSLLLSEQKEATQAAQFGQQAILLSDEIIKKNPNNIVYLKTRARVLFALSELDPAFLDQAILTIEQARKLAPTDAKLPYNQGLFYNQKGDSENAIKYMNEAIKLKPNYSDAYYSLALVYIDFAKKNPRQASDYYQKAAESLEFILKNIDPGNKAATDLLKSLQ